MANNALIYLIDSNSGIISSLTKPLNNIFSKSLLTVSFAFNLLLPLSVPASPVLITTSSSNTPFTRFRKFVFVNLELIDFNNSSQVPSSL